MHENRISQILYEFNGAMSCIFVQYTLWLLILAMILASQLS